MKKILITIALFLLMTPTTRASSEDDLPSFSRYSNTTYGFTLLTPLGWEHTEVNLPDRQILVLSRKDGSEIRISATPLDEKEKNKWDNWRDWCIDGIGGSLNEIVDRKDIRISKDINGRLIIFEYTAGRPVLQRVMIARFNKTQVVIECLAPTRLFTHYVDIFNTVMRSIDTQKESSESGN